MATLIPSFAPQEVPVQAAQQVANSSWNIPGNYKLIAIAIIVVIVVLLIFYYFKPENNIAQNENPPPKQPTPESKPETPVVPETPAPEPEVKYASPHEAIVGEVSEDALNAIIAKTE